MLKNRAWYFEAAPACHIKGLGFWDQYATVPGISYSLVALHGASANNMVIECIARATALLVNPLPAVVEYLGEGCPFYFRSLAEAAEKV